MCRREELRKSNRTNTLTLISDKTKLYDDKVVDDIYHYTGRGPSGDQKMSGQNLTLAESDGNGVENHFFEVMKPREYEQWRYMEGHYQNLF